MYKYLFCLLACTGPFFCSAQVVDRIKSASDDYVEQNSNQGGGGFGNDGGGIQDDGGFIDFGGGSPDVVYDVPVSNPENNYSRTSYSSNQVQPLFQFRRRNRDQGSQGEVNVQPPARKVMEDSELARYLTEEARRGRFRRGFIVLSPQAILRSELSVFQPKAQLGWGNFSTELRINQIVEYGINWTAHYRTWDWQILKLRILDGNHLSFSFGFGLMYEEFNDQFFRDYTFEFAFSGAKGRAYIPIEIRYAGTSNSMARGEASAAFNWQIYGSERSSIFANIGASYQNYFGEVGIYGVLAGFRISIF